MCLYHICQLSANCTWLLSENKKYSRFFKWIKTAEAVKPHLHACPAEMGCNHLLSSSSAEAGGEARPADQETREAGPGGRQPGPEWRQRLAQVPPHEGDHSTSSTHSLSGICQPAEHSFHQYCPAALVRAAARDLRLHPQIHVWIIVQLFLKIGRIQWLFAPFRCL